ncbi:hypothetical protein FJY68_04000 [candidate division WOR-3 bacterium]|uniref:T9SS type A sorting domain-containing protein n=1 Tax=candidate division WOR-3 bacterium TaxID=2052148 RepID=A0A937XGH8_UNCW3|nr:hypothetical protein [candidate division WOR-3 bacterium]
MSQRSLVAALLLAAIAAAPADPTGWQDEVLVAAGSRVSSRTGLAISTSSGAIHVAGATSQCPQDCNFPWYCRSLDGGLSWSTAVVIAGGPIVWNDNAIALEARGGTVTALAPCQQTIYRDVSTDNGAKWQGSGSMGQGSRPALTSLFGSRYAVWDDDRYGAESTEIFFKRSPDGGSTWSPPPGQGVPPDNAMRLTYLPGRSEEADICTELPITQEAPPPLGGFIVVVWADNCPGGPSADFDLRTNWSGTGGESWFYGTSGRPVLATGGDSRYPAIDCYEAVYPWTLHLVWQEGGNSICYTRSTDRGASWDSLQWIGTGYHPDVVADQYGVHVVWWTHGMYTDVIKYRRSTDFGTNWDREVQLTSLQPSRIYSDSRWPKITADLQGRHVVFGDSREAGDALAVWYKQNPNVHRAGGGQSAGVVAAEPASVAVWPNPTSGPVFIHLSRTLGEGVSVVAFDAQGRVVKRLICSGSEARWDGRDESGRRLAAGVYYLRPEGLDSGARTQVLVLR